MAYGEIFEGTGEDLARRFAAMGQQEIKVLLLRPDRPAGYDPKIWERNDAILQRIMKDAPPLPERSFTAEDLYRDDD